MALFKFKCPQCGAAVDAEESLRGQVAECPSCGKGIVIPRMHLSAPRAKSIVAGDTVKVPPLSHPTLKPQPPDVLPSGAVPRAQTHYESTMEREAERRRSEKLLDAAMFLVKAIIVVLVVCAAGWVVNITLAKVKSAEYKKLDFEREVEFQRKAREMEDRIATMDRALEEARGMTEKERENARVAMDGHQKSMDELKRTHADEIDRLKRDHRQELDDLKARYERRIDEMAQSGELQRRISSSGNDTQRGGAKHENPTSQRTSISDSAQDGENDMTPKESVTELSNQIKRNLEEINKLRDENPACVLNPDSSKILNTMMRMCTPTDHKYTSGKQLTYVRDLFYCTACKRESSNGPCCRVSAKKGFAAWRKCRDAVEKTKEINDRIDELHEANKALKKRIQTLR